MFPHNTAMAALLQTSSMDAPRRTNLRKRVITDTEGSSKKKVKFNIPQLDDTEERILPIVHDQYPAVTSSKILNFSSPNSELENHPIENSLHEFEASSWKLQNERLAKQIEFLKKNLQTEASKHALLMGSYRKRTQQASQAARGKSRDALVMFKSRITKSKPTQRFPERKTKRKMNLNHPRKKYQKKQRMTATLPHSQMIRTTKPLLQQSMIVTTKTDLCTHIPTYDCRHKRTSISTGELNRLKNLVQEQENQILLLQSQIDNGQVHSPHSPSLDLFKPGHKRELHSLQNDFRSLDRRCLSLDRGCLNGPTMSPNSFDKDASNEVKLAEENECLKSELQEVRDQVELLEFRILEFTETEHKDTVEIDRESATQAPKPTDKDVLHTEISSSPVSLCSAIDYNTSFKPKLLLEECRKSLDQFAKTHQYGDSSINPLESLLDWVSALPRDTHTPQSPKHEDAHLIMEPLRQYEPSIFDIEHTNLSQELTDILSNLQISLVDTNSSDAQLLSVIEKLRDTACSANQLSDQMNILVKENKVLRDTVTTLSESHETRTEASGTESELVHGKSPSVSSDISDTESDFQVHPTLKSRTLMTASSFQESGIFDSPADVIEAATQTMEIEPSHHMKENELQKALERLNRIQSTVQGKDLRNLRLQDLQESDEYLVNGIETQVLLTKVEYECMVAAQKDLRADLEKTTQCNSQLEEQLCQLRNKLHGLESRTLSEETEVMRGAVRALEQRLQTSEKYRDQFFEEKCEYEEAENDARLMVQRLQSQLEATQEMESLLSASLSQEQEFCRDLQRRLRDYQEFEKESGHREDTLVGKLNAMHDSQKVLLENFETVRTQYSTFLFTMLLSNCWRQNALRSSVCKQVVLYSPRMAAFNLIDTHSHPWPCDSSMVEKNIKDQDIEMVQVNQDTSILSDREQYYLQQIEMLQHEKKSLRNDFETGHGEDLYQMMNLKSDLQTMHQAMQECQDEKCKLIMKLQESECLLGDIDSKHTQRYEHLKREYSSFIEGLRLEHDSISTQYEKRIQDLKNVCNTKEQSMADLVQQQTCIKLELAPYLQHISCSDSYHEDQSDSSMSNEQSLTDLVRDLVKTSSLLRDKNYELREKESAYMETINEADKIMSSHVNAYTKHIEDLEQALKQKNHCLVKIEDLMKYIRNEITHKCSNEMVDEIMEKYELAISKSSWTAKENDTQSTIDQADNEFWEKDLLLQKLMKLTSENNSLKSQLQQAHESCRRMHEIQQNMNFFKGRVEELESSEASLTEDNHKMENAMLHKDKKAHEKVSHLEEEVSTLRIRIDQADMNTSKMRSTEMCLKSEIESLKQQASLLQTELKENSDESMSCDSQHRSEVGKLRAQLKLVNSQFSEFGAVNGELREQLSKSEQSIREAVEQLKCRSKQHENDVLSFNLKLNQKESRVEELEAQLQQISHSTAANELDFFFSLPISSVHDILTRISDGLQKCKICQARLAPDIKTLMDSSSNISHLLNGKNDSDIEVSSSKTEQDSCKGGWSTDGIGLSEDNTSESLDDLETSVDRCQAPKPSAPPRPRRDAKKKKRVKRPPKQESSLLQELKESDVFWHMPKQSVTVLNELKSRVSELEQTLRLKEEDIRLADTEATELHGRLVKGDHTMSDKVKEVEALKSVLATLREDLVKAAEEYEKSRVNTEEKHKEDMTHLTEQLYKLRKQLVVEQSNTHEKAVLSNALLKIILLYVRRDGSQLVEIVKQMQLQGQQDHRSINDHNMSSVCACLAQLQEDKCMQVSKASAPVASRNEVSCAKTSMLISRSQSHSNSTQLKTRIPLLKAGAIHSLTSKKSCSVFNCYPKSRIPRLKSFPNLFKKNLPKEPTKQFATFSKRPSKRVHKSVTCDKIFEKPTQRLTTNSPKTFSSELEAIQKAPDLLRQTRSTSLQPNGHSRPMIALSKSVSHSSVVKSQRRESISGLTCSILHTNTKRVYHTTSEASGVPRPQNLRITRRVGVDGVVIAWAPMDTVAGFQVIVDGRVVQQVRSPKRTKALVNGLPFPDGFTIALVSVAMDGRCSAPALVSFQRSSAYKFPRSPKQTLWGSEQKCIPACF